MMKVRDLIKRLEDNGWRIARTKGSHPQTIIHRSREPLPLQAIRQ
jgi:predicted RNA binding protein YcfA (HicA-like mRNA interferase family)